MNIRSPTTIEISTWHVFIGRAECRYAFHKLANVASNSPKFEQKGILSYGCLFGSSKLSLEKYWNQVEYILQELENFEI